ncbi:hypothetical protein LZ554_009571 [Drepanopeziza brunnea f. sp. 'monogermtubi']|nr:hypothetical protein LZ554_009571 [Drepanopeziza brunnea f. sp. 'monogermtubi']
MAGCAPLHSLAYAPDYQLIPKVQVPDGRSEGQGRECQYDQKHITATVGDLAAFFFESEHLFPRASSCKLSV